MNPTKPIENTKTLIHDILKFIEGTPWRGLYQARLECLIEKVDMPCELAIAGRVKAGKSSFINALLGEDHAMVGTTETTATINFFKYGTPPDSDKPIKVIWDDGHEEWQSTSFLDSLQGNTRDAIKKAKRIDHLEYYLNKQELSNVTLVDTPGTGALVAEHNQRAEDYLKLREKHDVQSVKLKDRADAVIVVVGHVPHTSAKKIVEDFTDNTSFFNSIGVMSKIDNESSVTLDDWHRRCGDYSNDLHNQLYSVMPVSAGVYHWTKKLEEEGRLSIIQAKIRLLEPYAKQNAKALDSILSSQKFENRNKENLNTLASQELEKEFFEPVGLPHSERMKLMAGMEQCYSVFSTIAKELYFHTIEDAKRNLLAYSGMEELKNTLEKQFFSRSRIIRCSRILLELHEILDEISNRGLYDIKNESRNRSEYLKIVDDSNARYDVKESLRRLIERNSITTELANLYAKETESLINQIESLQIQFHETDMKAEGILLFQKFSNQFTAEEREEIEALLDTRQETMTKLNKQRQTYWRVRKSEFRHKPEVLRLIEIVRSIYRTT